MKPFLLAIALLMILTILACGVQKQRHFRTCDMPSLIQETCACSAYADQEGKIFVDVKCVNPDDGALNRRAIIRIEE